MVKAEEYDPLHLVFHFILPLSVFPTAPLTSLLVPLIHLFTASNMGSFKFG